LLTTCTLFDTSRPWYEAVTMTDPWLRPSRSPVGSTVATAGLLLRHVAITLPMVPLEKLPLTV